MVDRDFRLGAQGVDDYFARRIAPKLRGVSQDSPVVMMVGGQQGWGKTTLTTSMSRSPEWQDAVVLRRDDFDHLHPAFRQLALTDERNAHHAISDEADALYLRALGFAIANRFDIVLESPHPRPDGIIQLAGLLHDRDYGVHYSAVATDGLRSAVDALHRYHDQRSTVGYGTWIDPADLAARTSAAPEILDALEHHNVPDSVRVFARGPKLLYVNAAAGDSWQHPPGAAAAMTAERDRPWTPAEAARVATKLGRLQDDFDTLPADAQAHTIELIGLARDRIGRDGMTLPEQLTRPLPHALNPVQRTNIESALNPSPAPAEGLPGRHRRASWPTSTRSSLRHQPAASTDRPHQPPAASQPHRVPER